MNITILGAGSYGLALALAFYKNNNNITVWTKIEDEKTELLNTRENKKALPDVIIPNEIKITSDLSDISDSNLIILAIPVPFFRSTCLELKKYINDNMHFCIASKGIENNTNKFAHEIFTDVIDTNNYAVLSGPTFAIDLALNSTSGLTLATNNTKTANIIKNSLASNNLKVVDNDDIFGVELCGSIKNVMAIASGILDGMNQTETTKALFLTEAINEVNNLIVNLGGSKTTINTLAGVGDLLLTCTSTKSRNFTLGTYIAIKDKEYITEYINNTTVEGYHTLISIYELIKEKNINSPIVECLYKIIFEDKKKEELLNTLISI